VDVHVRSATGIICFGQKKSRGTPCLDYRADPGEGKARTMNLKSILPRSHGEHGENKETTHQSHNFLPPWFVIPAKAGIQDITKGHWIPGQARNDGFGEQFKNDWATSLRFNLAD
jgi:hypothetical protein